MASSNVYTLNIHNATFFLLQLERWPEWKHRCAVRGMGDSLFGLLISFFFGAAGQENKMNAGGPVKHTDRYECASLALLPYSRPTFSYDVFLVCRDQSST